MNNCCSNEPINSNSEKNYRVMMVGTAESSGGGITSVIKLMKKMPVWRAYSCYWLETQVQGNILKKLKYAISAAFKAFLVMGKFDIVHFHMVPGINLLVQFPELLAAKLYRKKIIAEVHVGNQLIAYSKSFFFRWWLKNVDLVLFLANKWKDLYCEVYSTIKTPSDVLYNACDMVDPIPVSEKKKIITFVGTLDANKAPDILLDAWSIIYNRFPDWNILFLGAGDMETYVNKAKDLGLTECVQFVGHVAGATKEQIFQEASIYCMCSYAEGFPVAVLEAWAHSTAVITTPVGGLPDVIEDNSNCLVFQFGDYDALAKNLEAVITDESLRERISKAGYVTAQTTFSLERISERIDTIYSDLLR